MFDLQGHRGARGVRPENTLPAFAAALEIGVTTLEMDVGITRDGAVVVTHDRVVSPLKCRPTEPAVTNDPLFPYVGRRVADLTLEQVKTLDCGGRYPSDPATDPFIDTQQPVPGATMPTLGEVFAMVTAAGADEVRFNIETKVDPRHPDETIGPEPFALRVLEVIDAWDMAERATVQSFDWRTLLVARRELPRLGRVALVEARTVHPRWLAGLELRDFRGDIAAAAGSVGAHVLSPEHAFLDEGMAASARRHGLAVIPWTVNRERRMAELVDLGVDGLITDYPDRLREVLAGRCLALPERHEVAQPDPAGAFAAAAA